MIISCPKCAALGHTERETLAWVTCPRASCGRGFLAWPSATDVDSEAELRERRFICAKSDLPFWDKSANTYVIEVAGLRSDAVAVASGVVSCCDRGKANYSTSNSTHTGT